MKKGNRKKPMDQEKCLLGTSGYMRMVHDGAGGVGRDLGSPIPITEVCSGGSFLEWQGSYSTSPSRIAGEHCLFLCWL